MGDPLTSRPKIEGEFSTTEMQHRVDQLMKEKVPSSRKQLLLSLSSACPSLSDVRNMQIIAETWTCWDEERYSGAEAMEWKTCIVEAAHNKAWLMLVKDEAEIFNLHLQLAAKACTWCTQIVSADLTKGFPERKLLTGGLAKTQVTVLSLASSTFVEGLGMSLLEEPLGSSLELLMSASFKLVEIVYRSLLKNRSLSSGDNQGMQKCCTDLLNSAYPLVSAFRKQIGCIKPEIAGNSSSRSSPGRSEQMRSTGIQIVALSIRSFTVLGALSAKSGANFLSLLNFTWKSIAALLQVEQGREIIASAVDISHIVDSLIRHAVQALKDVLQSWLQSSNPSEKHLRRMCIPTRYFLQIADKVSAFYPRQAMTVSKNTISFASKIYASLLLLNEESPVQNIAAQVLSEQLVPTACGLVHKLLDARSVDVHSRLHLLREIASDSDYLENSLGVVDLNGGEEENEALDEIFNNKSSRLGLLKCGRIALFLTLLRLSCAYDTLLISELCTKLQWLLDAMTEEGIYVLVMQRKFLPTKVCVGDGIWKWQLTFAWVSHALQTFALVSVTHETVWVEMHHFLFQNILHPYAVCGELILDVWCFIIRQSDPSFVRKELDSLLNLLHDLTSASADLWKLRRLARLLCALIEEAPETAAQVYSKVFQQDPFRSQETANVATLLLEEGLSPNLLDVDSREKSLERLLSFCVAGGKGVLDCLTHRQSDSRLAAQKQALKCLKLLLSESAYRGDEIKEHHLQEVMCVSHDLIAKHAQEDQISPSWENAETICYALQLIPHVQHMLDPAMLNLLLPKLYAYCQVAAEISHGTELKEILPEFLGNLSEVPALEQEDDQSMSALRSLYHLVLRERHWALAHLGLTSFTHFAAHTSCQDLWRFVPPDAALANSLTRDDTEDKFMNVLKAFIERESAQTSLAISDEELQNFRNEIKLLQRHKSLHEPQGRIENMDQDHMDVDKGTDISDFQVAVNTVFKGIGVLKERLPKWLETSDRDSQQWESLRIQLAEMNEEILALQQLG